MQRRENHQSSVALNHLVVLDLGFKHRRQQNQLMISAKRCSASIFFIVRPIVLLEFFKESFGLEEHD